MKMKHEDQVTYRKFTKYVRYSLPTVVDVKSIVSAFQTYGQIDRATLKRALSWGEEPHITIKEMGSIFQTRKESCSKRTFMDRLSYPDFIHGKP
jgi:Metallopeptidase toxin 3